MYAPRRFNPQRKDLTTTLQFCGVFTVYSKSESLEMYETCSEMSKLLNQKSSTVGCGLCVVRVRTTR